MTLRDFFFLSSTVLSTVIIYSVYFHKLHFYIKFTIIWWLFNVDLLLTCVLDLVFDNFLHQLLILELLHRCTVFA